MADTEDFYSTSEMTARLDLVRHLIENSELVPLVRGPAGIGKSVMASQLQQLAPENWVVCHFVADSMMQPERLLSHIARCNGLPDAQGENLSRLEERYAQLRKRGSTPVLLVDDAQALPPTSLITLLRLYERQVGGTPLVSLVLFANEQIDMLLSTPQLQVMTPQAIQVIDLLPLTREEANGFMRYLLNAEGLGERFLLDEAKMNRIYRETSGIPGLMASAVLATVGEADDSSKPKTVGSSIKRPLFVFGIPLVALILILLVFQDAINQLFQPSPESQSAVKEEALTPERVGRKPEGDKEIIASVPDAQVSLPLSTPAPVAEVEPVVLPPPADTGVQVTPPDNSIPEETVPPLLSQAKDEVSKNEGTPGATESQSPGEAQVVKQPTESGGVYGQASTKSVEVADQEEPSQTPAMAEKQPQPASQNQPISTPAPEVSLTKLPGDQTPVSSLDRLLKTSDWLASQPQGSYTIQLLAVENIDSIRPVIARHGIAEKAFAIESQRHGKPWYPLLWGVFPDRPAALAALKQLPPSLQKGGAWARPLTSLQQ